jgi:hypothetical protein
MIMDLPPCAFKAIDKVFSGEVEEMQGGGGGHCLVPGLRLLGLGISHLQQFGWALRMRWLWLQKTELDGPWAAFQI